MEIKVIDKKLDLKLKVNAMDLVEEVMTQISLNLKINAYRLELIYNNARLEKDKTLRDYQIKTKDKLELNVLSEEMGRKYEKLFTTKTTIKISNEEREMISYSEIRLITVFDTLKQVMTDPKPYYCLMFGKIIL
jgi:hypothetical protein